MEYVVEECLTLVASPHFVILSCPRHEMTAGNMVKSFAIDHPEWWITDKQRETSVTVRNMEPKSHNVTAAATFC